MTNTGQTIETLKTFRANVNQQMLEREIISFNVGSIDIDSEKMSVSGVELSEAAVKKVLGHLRVKNNFLDLGKKMTPSDWTTVKDKLKSASFNQTVHARKVKDAGLDKIDDIYMAAPKTTGVLEIDAIFGELIESVISTGKDISMKESYFLTDKDEACVTLLENDDQIDIIGNGSDMWKMGKQIVWNGMNFSISPFFERLVCTNGNTAKQYGFKANISNNKFNIDKIKKIMEAEITLQSDTHNKYLIDATHHLRQSEVSVREFLTFRNLFNENDHEAILKKWFDESYLNRAYGVVVADQPGQWQVTAETGKNAYNFFNDLTYIASHPADAKLTDRERLSLQIKASDLLFRKSFDLENRAPKPDWNKHRVTQSGILV